MDIAAYEVEAKVESTHWWFHGRKRLFKKILSDSGILLNASILDVGSSTGTNLRMLKEAGYTNYEGLDFSPESVKWCAQKDLGTVRLGDVCAMPYPDNHFDFVLATDIIEHVANDRQALAEIMRVLKPGGSVLIAVPAFPLLWGLQDKFAHHERRYKRGNLREKVSAAGLAIDWAFYFNYLLFVPIFLARQILNVVKPNIKSENEINNPVINAILKAVFCLDVWTAPKIHPPFGVSIACLAHKPHNQ